MHVPSISSTPFLTENVEIDVLYRLTWFQRQFCLCDQWAIKDLSRDLSLDSPETKMSYAHHGSSCSRETRHVLCERKRTLDGVQGYLGPAAICLAFFLLWTQTFCLIKTLSSYAIWRFLSLV